MDRNIDEIVKNLLKFVVRGFYGGSYVLVLDAILFHSVLAEDDLKQLLSINKTDLGPLVARLRSDRLVSIHKQREYPPNSKSVERIYYYIKFPHAIDAIKWKVHQVVQRLKDDLDKNSAPNGYMCPICSTKYTQLEAVQLLNFDRTEFLCSLCDEPLIEDDSGKKNKEKQDKLNRLMDQVQPIIDYLKRIDDSRIEENTFEIALARLIPPQNQSHAAYTFNPKKGSNMFRPGDAPIITGLNNDNSRRAGANSQATLHINITTASDEIAQSKMQERQAEEKRKQNAVPEWHKQSTIGESALGRLDDEDEFDPQQKTQGLPAAAGDLENGSDGFNYNGNHRVLTEQEIEERENERALNDYYAALAKKQAAERKKEEEEEEEEIEEDGDEEMEDIDVNTGAVNGISPIAEKVEDEDEDEDEDEAAFEDDFEDVMEQENKNKEAVAEQSKKEEKPAETNDDNDGDDDMDIEFEDV